MSPDAPTSRGRESSSSPCSGPSCFPWSRSTTTRCTPVHFPPVLPPHGHGRAHVVVPRPTRAAETTLRLRGSGNPLVHRDRGVCVPGGITPAPRRGRRIHLVEPTDELRDDRARLRGKRDLAFRGPTVPSPETRRGHLDGVQGAASRLSGSWAL